MKLPEILNNEIYLVEMALPSETEIKTYLQHFVEINHLSNRISVSVMHQYTIALMGLTINEIEHLLVRLFASKEQDFEQLLPDVYQEKSQMLKKENCLEFISTQQSLDQTGGLDNLKEWVLQRKNLFTEEAFNSGLPLPSGILFMGVSGCGKSMAAKLIATANRIKKIPAELMRKGRFDQLFSLICRIRESVIIF